MVNTVEPIVLDNNNIIKVNIHAGAHTPDEDVYEYKQGKFTKIIDERLMEEHCSED